VIFKFGAYCLDAVVKVKNHIIYVVAAIAVLKPWYYSEV